MEKDFRANEINKLTLEVISKGIYKETAQFGFSTQDYIKLVNQLLDLTIKEKVANNGFVKDKISISKIEKTPDLPLTGKHVNIRNLNPEKDYNIIEKWISDEKGRLFLLSRLTAKEHDLDELLSDSNNSFGIITLKDDTPIGLLAFLDYDNINNKAELRKLLGEKEFRGKGFAKEATKLWVEYGITKLKLRKIYLHTIDTNIANIRLNKDLGFKIEGILRKECLIDGEYHDVLRMALIVDE